MPEFAPNIFRTEAMDCGRLPPDLPLAGRWTPPLQGQQVAPQPSSAHAGLPFRHPETIHESKQPECGSFPGEGHYDISVCVYQKLLRGMLGVNVFGFIIHHMGRQIVPGTHWESWPKSPVGAEVGGGGGLVWTGVLTFDLRQSEPCDWLRI